MTRPNHTALVSSLVGLACTLVLALGHEVRAQGTTPGTTPRSFTLALGGDVIFDAPIEYVLRTRGLSPDDASSYDELFAELRAPLSAADLAIVNLETPVGVRVRERSEAHDFPTFAAPSAFLDALARTGVDVVTVANNHAYDQGVAGLERTLGHASRSRLTVSGTAEADGYSVSRVRDVRVAVVSLTQGTNHRVGHDEPATPRVHFFDQQRLGALVAHARAHADVVIVALHFTDTGEHMPTEGMRRWGRRAAEAGADLVVGHGPHVPASSEWLDVGERRVLVLHSLGNLVAAMQAEAHAERSRRVHVRDSVVVSLRVELRGERVTIEPPRVSAYWIDDARSTTGGAPFTRPVAIDAQSAEPLARRAERLAALFSSTHAETVVASASTSARAPAQPVAHVASNIASSTPTSSTTASSTAARASATPTLAAVAASSGARAAPSATPTVAGSVLGVTFRCGSATESSLDAASIDAWVTRMRDDRRLRVEVVSTRCEGESESLAERRARRAAGLIATRGPSRSRFSWRASDEVTTPPRITLR